ncbi:MAG TPA: polymer-forming cytoskeletal protein [Spirochaetales bacterium]|nr:polymer-forming cytoskeletal protein [Spirochaetales bacterium]HRY54852.1 polymer-forming cytoskeletal protein [Spirochaetia bacterium]HRZ65780.1 polymer-forming cytoskeletal protein [Spirochaetia bacterium]
MPDIKDSLVNSIIGSGSSVDGDIDVDGLLRIDGDVRGSVRATGKVVVGAAGRVEASIRAQSAIVGGIVKGDVYVAKALRILAGGIVIGNVFASRLEAEDGTVVHGDVAVTGRPESAEDDLAAFVGRHGDKARFLGPFRAACFAPPRGRAGDVPSAKAKATGAPERPGPGSGSGS